MAKSVSLSEARRLLPSLVDAVSKDGGRVDITRRGVPLATLVRTSDLDSRQPRGQAPDLGVEFSFDPADLVLVVRDLRSRVGRPKREKVGSPSSSGKRPGRR